MIKNNSVVTEKYKCVFSLDSETMTYNLNTTDVFNISNNSLIVNIETLTILKSKVISVELIGVGYEEGVNAYKKYTLQERELKESHDKLIKKERLDRMFINRMNEYGTVSSIILSIFNNIA